MVRRVSPAKVPRPQILAEQGLATLERVLRIDAVGGIVLLIAAAVALVWANSPVAESYDAVWHLNVTLGLGTFTFSQPLHFWINDGLMTIFFLVVGMEIRREIHDGALSKLSQAVLPLAAAAGGVVVPALIYVTMNATPERAAGWAIPTATDIALAGGELLIPTLILLFGADVKLAGSLSLAVSLPTMLVSFARYSRDQSFTVVGRTIGFAGWMATGSIVGSLVGGLPVGIIPAAILLPALAAILLFSAFKVWSHR